MNRQNKVITTIAILLVAATAAWGFGVFGTGVDPEVAELQDMRDEMLQKREQMDRDKRRQSFEQMRGRIEGLSEDQRRAFFESSRPVFMRMASERMTEFFAMTPEEQNRQLDQTIDRINEWRSNREQRGGDRGRGNGGAGGPGGRRGNMTEEQRDERRKRRLDATSPELRAQFTEYRRRLNERLEERGEPPMTGPPRPGMFGGRGPRS